MEISPYKFNLSGADPKPDYVHVAPCPDVYGGIYKDKDYGVHPNMATVYAKPVIDICDRLQRQGRGLAAFIAESLQSCGGQIIPPKDYFKEIFAAVHKVGGVCIMDEVQVGFGRVGSHYWAFEALDVIPDIVTVAKSMGNGHPVGAVITTKKIAAAFYNTGVSYFNTYGGNPVSCAIANAVMKVIDEEGLQENARRVGDYLLRKCQELKRDFQMVGDVRGIGLFVGIELVKSRETRKPDTKSAHWVVDRMKDTHRILISSDGPNDNVIKLKPPMCFNHDNANTFVMALRECLTLLEQKDQVNDILHNNESVELLTNSTKVIFEHREQLIKSL